MDSDTEHRQLRHDYEERGQIIDALNEEIAALRSDAERDRAALAERDRVICAMREALIAAKAAIRGASHG